MPESTAKKNLLLQDDDQLFTPEKAVVSTDLNGWMETQEKLQNLQNKCINFRLGKKIHSKPVYETPTGLNQLKARKQTLMRSSFKKQLFHKQLATRASSNDHTKSTQENKSTSRRTLWINRLPLIKVNEFNVNDSNSQTITLIPEQRPLYTRHLKRVKSRSNTQQEKTQKQGIKSQRIINQKDSLKAEFIDTIECFKDKLRKQQGITQLSRKTTNILMHLHKNRI